MDFGIAGVAAITVICYLIGMGCKASSKVKDEVIPVTCGVAGQPGSCWHVHHARIPRRPMWSTAVAIGIVSGLAATGVNQMVKQLGGNKA